ncbi:MAG: diguanylate cyclase [Burkholderiaceae bacterium]|nr:diguanylate cyclase [Burkholderiaceae bacterium]
MDNTLHRLADLVLDAVFLVEEGGRIAFVNPACTAIFGYQPEEMIGRVLLDFIHPDDRERTIAEMRHVLNGLARVGFENRYLRKDKSVAHIMWSARWSPEDRLRIGVARDITGRKQAEERQAGMLALSTAAHGAESVLAMFTAFHVTLQRLLPVYGLAALLEPGERVAYSATRPGIMLELPDMEDWYGLPMTTAEANFGELRLDLGHAKTLSTGETELLQFAAAQAAAEIERFALQADLARAARYDDLTGLPNRRLFQDRIHSAFARCRRGESSGALLFIDLDDFKGVNDAHGHAAGDQLLQTVAGRIASCVREADTVARIGGDEFVVLIEGVYEREHAEAVAAKIHTAIGEPVDLAGHRLLPQASIGVALYPEHGKVIDQLMRHADQAMYACKLGRKAGKAMGVEA